MVLPAFRESGARAARRSGDRLARRGRRRGRLAFTTDSYVVTPMFFPGRRHRRARGQRDGERSRRWAAPSRWRSRCAFILEEGLPLDELRRVIASAPSAPPRRAGVPIVTGDTKVVGRGAATRSSSTPPASGSFQTAFTCRSARDPSGRRRSCSPAPIGDHGVAILARARRAGARRRARERHRRAAPSWRPSSCAPRPARTRCGIRPAAGWARVLVEIADASQAGHRDRRGRRPGARRRAGRVRDLGLDPLLRRERGQAGGVRSRGGGRGGARRHAIATRSGGSRLASGGSVQRRQTGGPGQLRTPVGGRRMSRPARSRSRCRASVDAQETEGGFDAETRQSERIEEVHILWISEGMSCDGDTVSITAATPAEPRGRRARA